MDLRLTRDLEEFAGVATPLLEGRLENNQLATVLVRARTGSRGHLRLPTDVERGLLIGWEDGFLNDVGIEVEIPRARLVDARLAAAAQFVWDDGRPVSTLATSPEVARTVRIGPVYTPPEHRGRGYASSAVASWVEIAFAIDPLGRSA